MPSPILRATEPSAKSRMVRVLSATNQYEPTGPVDGDAYILPANPIGNEWSYADPLMIAEFVGSRWHFITPHKGMSAFVHDIASPVQFDGANWVATSPGAAALDTDPELAADSDTVAPSQKAIKAYVDERLDAIVSGGINT